MELVLKNNKCSYLNKYNVASEIMFTEEKHNHSKLFKKAPHVICEISDIDIFITDKEPPEKFKKIAEKNNTEIIIANSNWSLQ